MEMYDQPNNQQIVENEPTDKEDPLWSAQMPTDAEMLNLLSLSSHGYNSMSFTDMLSGSLAAAGVSIDGQPFPAFDPGLINQMMMDPTTISDLGVGGSYNDSAVGDLPSVPLAKDNNRNNQLSVTSQESPSKDDASSPSVSGLLGTFYRLARPTPIAQFSDEHLVTHYFSEVCSLYSCFDSVANPFRSLVSNLWTTSTTIYLSIQSMAIANLSNHYLYMAPLGQSKRSQAWKSLQYDLQLFRAGGMPLEKILVSLLLLGLSSPWHQPSNLGLQYLFIARNLLQAYLRSDANKRPPHLVLTDEKFFMDAFMYWEMLATFVDPIPMMPFPGFGSPKPQVPAADEKKAAHPWAGLTAELQFALAEIGRLLRRRRGRTGATRRIQQENDDDSRWAASLEEFLYGVQIPSPSNIVDYSDDNTPTTDLIRIAEAQRFIGLLEIYNAYSQCLERQIHSGVFPNSQVLQFGTPTDHTSYSNKLHSWLCAMAMYTLDVVREISISSASCRLLPLILMSCSSQLRLPDHMDALLDETSMTKQNEVVEHREFVESRMFALSRKYPQRQMLLMLDVMKESWHRLDHGFDDSHWLDVAHEREWLTMMG